MKGYPKSGQEQDAIYAKNVIHFRPGERKAAKKAINKRFRKDGKKVNPCEL